MSNQRGEKFEFLPAQCLKSNTARWRNRRTTGLQKKFSKGPPVKLGKQHVCSTSCYLFTFSIAASSQIELNTSNKIQLALFWFSHQFHHNENEFEGNVQTLDIFPSNWCHSWKNTCMTKSYRYNLLSYIKWIIIANPHTCAVKPVSKQMFSEACFPPR